MNSFATAVSFWTWIHAAYEMQKNQDAVFCCPVSAMNTTVEVIIQNAEAGNSILTALDQGPVQGLMQVVKAVLPAETRQIGMACLSCFATFMCSKAVPAIADLFTTTGQLFTKHLRQLVE
ncbi:MAG: hypothetical protein HC767_00030 [Akkermansiaceae bacterium]|nr:hypothetical protein [Akkermansiaceae bacterium]